MKANIRDYIRVESDKGMLEGTVTFVSSSYLYVDTVCGSVYIVDDPDKEITVLKSAEPKELGTVVSMILKSDNLRYTAVRAENSDEDVYAWYIPCIADKRNTGSWHTWDEFKDVEYV